MDNAEEEVLEKVEDRLDDTKTYIESQKEEIDEQIEHLEAKIEEQEKLSGEASEEHVEQLEKLQKTYNDLAERMDSVEKDNNRLGGGMDRKSFHNKVREKLSEEKDKLEALQSEKVGRASFEMKGTAKEMQQKATMTESSDLTDQVIEPTRVPGVVYSPDRRTHVREFLPTATTSSNVIWYIQEENFTDNTQTVSENTNKPESDFDLNQQEASVQTIANTFRVSKRMLDDIDYLSGHISTRGRTKYMLEEDNQILYGSGSGTDLNGLFNSLNHYDHSFLSGDSNAQEFDVLVDSIRQLAINEFRASAIMISPSRYYDMLLRKDADGNYVMPGALQTLFQGQPPQVDGVPVIQTTALNNDDFIVADFPMATTLFDREGVNVRFFEQDRDNVQKNLITVRIEGRVALPTYLTGAGRQGNFASAIDAAGNS